MKEKEDIRVRESLLKRDREKSMDLVSVAISKKPSQYTKLDLDSSQIGATTQQNDESDEEEDEDYGSMHSSPLRNQDLEDRKRQ